jgi:hypothetical protein
VATQAGDEVIRLRAELAAARKTIAVLSAN